MKKIFVLAFYLALFTFYGCDEGKVNFFTVDQDIQFGQQLDSAILADPVNYPILSIDNYPEAYEHLYRIRDEILQSDKFRYAQRFDWEIKIIHRDDILNAFAAPGGYMYFYTGLIHFLDDESQFAGVVGHEMAHADRRHSTEMLTKQYGFSLLLGIILGDNPSVLESIIADLALGLGALKYSRNNEYEADEYAVKYLYDTDYHPLGVAGFFQKLDGASTPPEFLSTHPSPENRIEAIYAVWESLGSKVGETFPERYQDFKNSLPTP
jgi:Zn-dependent protease with chaperone function